jgi:hypothetical protein
MLLFDYRLISKFRKYRGSIVDGCTRPISSVLFRARGWWSSFTLSNIACYPIFTINIHLRLRMILIVNIAIIGSVKVDTMSERFITLLHQILLKTAKSLGILLLQMLLSAH